MIEPTIWARRTDPETSHEAAASVDPDKRTAIQENILRILRTYGPTSDVGIWHYDPLHLGSPSGARTRRAELVAMGLVKDSGVRVVGPSGRKMIVWQAV